MNTADKDANRRRFEARRRRHAQRTPLPGDCTRPHTHWKRGAEPGEFLYCPAWECEAKPITEAQPPA